MADLEVWTDNVRKMDSETFNQLALEIKNEGFLDPITVVRYGNKWRCLDGNHRLLAARDVLHMTEVPCIEVGDNWPEDKFVKAAIKWNALRGEFDKDLLYKALLGLRRNTSLKKLKTETGLVGPDSMVDRLFSEYKKRMTPEQKAEMDKAKSKLKTVDDVRNTADRIIRKRKVSSTQMPQGTVSLLGNELSGLKTCKRCKKSKPFVCQIGLCIECHSELQDYWELEHKPWIVDG